MPDYAPANGAYPRGGGVDFIAAGAFYGCHAWCSVTWIGNHAFSGCAALQNFHARPEGVAAFFLRPFHRD